MSLLPPTAKKRIDRLFDRLETVSEWQLFGFCLLWVVAGGGLLQFVVLPYVVPYAHWGHGLIADLDSVGFHIAAVENAERIQTQGWSAWELAPENYSISIASALYAVIYPEPWVVLPVNAVLFGVAIVAVRRLLAVMFDSRATGLVALMPFFVFPSFVPIWGQLHRDLSTGAGLSLVLCSLVLAGSQGRGSAGTFTCALIALAGMGVVWISRSYAMAVIAAGTVAFVALALLTKRCERGRLSAVALVVVLAAASSLGIWTRPRVPLNPPPPLRVQTPVTPPANTSAEASRDEAPAARPGGTATVRPGETAAVTPVETPGSISPDRSSVSRGGWLPRIRQVDPSLPRRYENCLPEPSRNIFDRLLYNLCIVREGYVIDSTLARARSGYDYDVRLRSAQDFVAYGPRAVGLALFQPGPQRWMREASVIGKLGSYFVPLEMLVAYICFFLAVVFARRRLARFEVWAVIAFCVTYTLFYVLATPQMGTLYRMRAFAFAILVSTGLAAVAARLKAGE